MSSFMFGHKKWIIGASLVSGAYLVSNTYADDQSKINPSVPESNSKPRKNVFNANIQANKQPNIQSNIQNIHPIQTPKNDNEFAFMSITCKVPTDDTATTVHTPGYDTYSPTAILTKNHATAEEIDDICDLKRFTHLPTISLKEIEKHFDRSSTGIWVTWKGGVYDVTHFLDHHPGGPSRIEMVGGQDLTAFWEVYTLHRRKHIQNLLQMYRIGNLSITDRKIAEDRSIFHNIYQDTDPERPDNVQHADTITTDFIVASVRPWNAEPRDLRILSNTFYTPNDKFFVRNHNNVPTIDEYELEISGSGIEDITLSLSDIKTLFPSYTISSVIQCAGNRQEDYNHTNAPLYVAPHWHNSAIGNATWTGVKIRDVLKYAGLDVDGLMLETNVGDDSNKINWVAFVGYDCDETGVEYAGVLPIEKVVNSWGDCILAYEMNGEQLPADHGWPLRVIAPGHAGCRQVKWVHRIELCDKPSELDSGSKLDRHFAPNICFDKLRLPFDTDEDMECAPVIQTLPVQSIICDYVNVDNEYIHVKGVAWAGGGKGIARVDISVDGGQHFSATKIVSEVGKNWNRNWSWVQFYADVKLDDEQIVMLKNGELVEMQLVSKAIDDNFNAQPENMQPYYNVLGICINHWKRINIHLEPLFSSEYNLQM